MSISTKTPINPPLPPPLPGAISVRPARVRWSIDDLLSRDGHRLTISFVCTASAIDEPTEAQMFHEAFAATPMAGSKAAVAHFLPALRTAGAELAGKETVENLLATSARSTWIEALRAAANETAFACGIQIVPPYEVEVTSPTLQKERLEQMQRTAAERRFAERAGRFARAAELLRQWDSLKADVPSITPGKLLEQINPADRGQMLDTLLMASAKEATEDLWAVSGSMLVRLGMKGEAVQPQAIGLPSTIGPFRSVRADDGKLVIGARNGVFLADPANLQGATAYRHGNLTSDYGFTAVTVIGEQIWACHREGGLVGWNLNQPDEAAMVNSPTGLGAEPRHLTQSGVFAAGAKLYQLTASGPQLSGFSAPSSIVAILPCDRQLIVVDESGAIAVLDEASLAEISKIGSTGRVSSAALLPWLGSSRLLLNRADGPIECVGLEDQLITRFGGGHTGLRAVAATAAKVAAMSNDRSRVLLWNAWDGRTPAADVHLPSLTQHRIADIAFV